MVSIDDIKTEWSKDAIVDQLHLNDEIVKVPLLHAKYLDFLIEFRARRSSILKRSNALKFIKRKYYRGELTQFDLREHGWSQYQGLKPSNSEMKDLFEQDSDLNEFEEKLEYYNTGLNVIEYIMRAIHSRGYELKTLFEYRKFTEGG